jgi:hypothetical protein
VRLVKLHADNGFGVIARERPDRISLKFNRMCVNISSILYKILEKFYFPVPAESAGKWFCREGENREKDLIPSEQLIADTRECHHSIFHRIPLRLSLISIFFAQKKWKRSVPPCVY